MACLVHGQSEKIINFNLSITQTKLHMLNPHVSRVQSKLRNRERVNYSRPARKHGCGCGCVGAGYEDTRIRQIKKICGFGWGGYGEY